MTQQTAAKLIEQSLTAIYGYAYDQLYDKSDAQDLAQEIVLEILRSAEHLKTDEAFWGFAWKIAENTFRKFIKRRELMQQDVSLDGGNLVEILSFSEAEASEEQDEQIYRLRRELSLLGKRHREICVSYYVNQHSCSSIAKEQGISVEMVKQHLFKARKLLKEGMDMERKLGEKSYNPGTFKLNFFGDWYHYGSICNRKLPGAILLEAYNRPMTAEELSLELGVAMPYLEEEIDTLEAAGLLLKNGKKIETNLVILTDTYEKELEEQSKDAFHGIALQIYESLKALLPQIRGLDFHGNDYEEHRLLFGLINIALLNGYDRTYERSPLGVPPKLPLGGNGWLFGRDHRDDHLPLGNIVTRVDNKSNTAWFAAMNYRATMPVQNFEHTNFMDKVEAMCAAILGEDGDRDYETLPWLIENRFILSQNGRLSANFPVFDSGVYQRLLALISPVCDDIAVCMIKASDDAARQLVETAPLRLQAQCVEIAKLQYRLNASAYVMESLTRQGLLSLPEEKTPLCVYGVRIAV